MTKQQLPKQPQIQLNSGFNSDLNIDEELKSKVNDISNFYDPKLRHAYMATVFTRRPIPDFLLAFGDRNNVNNVRAQRAKLLAKMQTVRTTSSLTDTIFTTFYLMATMTLRTVLHMSVDPRLAWTKYKQKLLPPFVVIEYSQTSEFDSIDETRAHLSSGNGMKIIRLNLENAHVFSNELVHSGINTGVFLSFGMKQRLTKARVSSLSRLPVYTNLISPDNFVGVYATKTLKLFPNPSVRDVQILMTLIQVTQASAAVMHVLHGVQVNSPRTWYVMSKSVRLCVVAYSPPPEDRDSLVQWVNQGQTTILSGTTPEEIPEALSEENEVKVVIHDDLPISTTLLRKVKNLVLNITSSKCLVIMGKKAAGKTNFIASLDNKYAIVDSDDWTADLTVPFEAAASALIAVTSAHRDSPITLQANLGTLIDGGELKFAPPVSRTESMKNTMAIVHRKYALEESLPTEVRVKETNMIYNIASAMLTDGFQLNMSYLLFLSELKKESRPIVVFVHTDSEAVAVRAVLRRGTVVGVSSGILPSEAFIENRQRDFVPFQYAIMSMYSKDLIGDYLSFDAIRHALKSAWD